MYMRLVWLLITLLVIIMVSDLKIVYYNNYINPQSKCLGQERIELVGRVFANGPRDRG